MCYADYGDRCSVWDKTHPKARKRHTCDLCRMPIVAGTVYTRVGGLFDGSWFTLRVHQDCENLSGHIQTNVCGQEVVFLDGDLREEVREHYHEAPEVLRMYRDVLRARRAEGSWPARRAA